MKELRFAKCTLCCVPDNIVWFEGDTQPQYCDKCMEVEEMQEADILAVQDKELTELRARNKELEAELALAKKSHKADIKTLHETYADQLAEEYRAIEVLADKLNQYVNPSVVNGPYKGDEHTEWWIKWAEAKARKA